MEKFCKIFEANETQIVVMKSYNPDEKSYVIQVSFAHDNEVYTIEACFHSKEDRDDSYDAIDERTAIMFVNESKLMTVTQKL